MPHTKQGEVIAAGDVVLVYFSVKSVDAHEEYCNITLESIEPMYPGDNKTCVVLNARQVARVVTPPANAPGA